MGLSRSSACVFLAISLSSCAYVIPPEQNAPRNNTVLGERHKPQMNVNVPAPQSALVPAVSPVPMPDARIEAMNLPPVDAATQVQADQVIAARTNGGGTKEGRFVPTENQQFQVSSADFPAINSVPPRPVMTGQGSAQERLNATKEVLEQNRVAASIQKDALAKDVAAEPSMLSALPKTDGVVPPADPVQVAPVMGALPPAPEPLRPAPVQQQAPTKPEAAIVRSSSVDMAQAPCVLPTAHTEARLSPAASMRQPIILKQPLMRASEGVAPAVPPRAGDFDPLSVADNAPVATPLPVVRSYGAAPSSYVSNVYIAPSRYAVRHY